MSNKYPGHKGQQGVYHTIINNIPEHGTFIELFAGSGAITFELHKIAAMPNRVILNDIDAEVQHLLTKKFKGVREVILRCLDWSRVLKYNYFKQFFFVDPPYLHSTRPNNTKLYNYEMSEVDHIQLLSSLLESKSMVMIIHPQCELYDTILKDWRKVNIKIRYHNKISIECLYMNYPPHLPLQCTAYLGDNCWDRQAINRKVANMVRKYKELPLNIKTKYIEALRKEKLL